MARYGMVMDLRTCVGCQACTAACSIENQTPFWSDKFRTRVLDKEVGHYPEVGRYFVPTICMHCEEPPCVEPCPTNATYKTEDGFVLVDYDRCMGCKACMAACPYQARYIYDRKDVEEARQVFGRDFAQHPAPHVDKCTFCEDRVGRGMEPACVTTCPSRARIFGDLDDPDSEVSKLVASGLAKPLRPELGTRPKVFYIW